MVSAPLHNLDMPCLLWQIDSDELWRTDQITAVRRLFLEQPQRSAAFFWCDYFVGPDAVVVTRYNYTQDTRYEWLRVWRYRPGDRWRSHEPPTLVRGAEESTMVMSRIWRRSVMTRPRTSTRFSSITPTPRRDSSGTRRAITAKPGRSTNGSDSRRRWTDRADYVISFPGSRMTFSRTQLRGPG